MDKGDPRIVPCKTGCLFNHVLHGVDADQVQLLFLRVLLCQPEQHLAGGTADVVNGAVRLKKEVTVVTNQPVAAVVQGDRFLNMRIKALADVLERPSCIVLIDVFVHGIHLAASRSRRNSG